MLALSGRILGSNLVAIDALYRHALVLLFRLELDKGGVDIVKGRSGQA
jgi:hypothetical protein